MSHRHIRYGDRSNANEPKGSRRQVATVPGGLNEINSTTAMVCDRPAMIAENVAKGGFPRDDVNAVVDLANQVEQPS